MLRAEALEPPLVTLSLPSGGAAATADVLAFAVRRGGLVAAASVQLGARHDVDIARLLDRAAHPSRAGEVIDVPVTRRDSSVQTLLLVGIDDGGARAARKAGAALARQAVKAAHVASDLAEGLGDDALRALVEAIQLARYRYRISSSTGTTQTRFTLVGIDSEGRRRAVTQASRVSRAVYTARDLANTPSNIKDPRWLAAEAGRVARRGGLTISVKDEKALRAGGFGGLLAVGSGSSRGPRLIQLGYSPARAARSAPHVVLIGKGITFDSGGLSLKPRESMVLMKTDMAAGAAVIAVMGALRDLDIRLRVTGLVAAAENLPGASAYRPGDVITQYGGTTVEVFNTDAEGRLVLADALAHADRDLAPDVVIDLATLTGAASVGLGRRHAALYTEDDELLAGLTAAGDRSGDRIWHMPLVDDYRAALDSEVADLSHISRDRHISGGSIVAALFLREFAGARRWAHLDIAGPARAERDEHEITKGATGYGVRLLLSWLDTLSGDRRPSGRSG